MSLLNIGMLASGWLLSCAVLTVLVMLVALCVCGKRNAQKDSLDTVETRCVTYTQSSPQLTTKQTISGPLPGDLVVSSMQGGPQMQSDSPTPHSSTPTPNHGHQLPHTASPHMHVSDRALPTPPGRPQSLPAGLPSTSMGAIGRNGRPRKSHQPQAPSPAPNLPPAPSGPAPQPPALGEDFARNEGIPDIDADMTTVEVVTTNQSDIPYTVISVREPLANLREETRLLMESATSQSQQEVVQSPSGRSGGEQYYAVVLQEEEMYAEIESANSSVTYARIEPRQNPAITSRSLSGQVSTSDSGANSSPVSIQSVVDGAPAPPTVESLKSVAQAHSRQASTSSIFTSVNGTSVLTVVSNGADVNVLNNLYSAVDRNAKIHRKVSSEGHSGDSVSSDIDQLYAKVSKKSKKTSPSSQPMATPPAHSPAPMPHPPPMAKVNFENNNSIGVVLPPMTLKRKTSRASRGGQDDEEDPCYEMVGGANAEGEEEPKYERLKGSASSDTDPNYEQLKSKEDPCYEALGEVNGSDADPCYERVSRRESDVTDPNYERLQQGATDSDPEPRYERVRPMRDDSSDIDPCYERVGGPQDEYNEPQYERVLKRSKPRREDSLSSDPGYEAVRKPNGHLNGLVVNGDVASLRMNGHNGRSLVTVNSHVVHQDPDYETVNNTPEIVML